MKLQKSIFKLLAIQDESLEKCKTITSRHMRLSPFQSQIICQQIHHHFGDSAAIWLFGSRIDDQKRGGDVDLYVEAAPHTLLDEIRCKINLEESLSMPVDLIVRQPVDGSLIAQIAKTQGCRL